MHDLRIANHVLNIHRTAGAQTGPNEEQVAVRCSYCFSIPINPYVHLGISTKANRKMKYNIPRTAEAQTGPNEEQVAVRPVACPGCMAAVPDSC